MRKTVKPSRRAPNLAATLAQRGDIARSHHRSGRVCVEVDPKSSSLLVTDEIKGGDWLWSRARADAVREPRALRNILK